MRKNSLLFVILLICFSLSLTTLGNEKQIVIGYAAPNMAEEAQMAIGSGLFDFAKENNIKVISTNADSDVQKQINQFEDLVTMGVNAIVINPTDSDALSEAVKKANLQNIPVFCIDRNTSAGKLELTVTGDNYMGGYMGAEAMVKLLEKKYGKAQGTVLEIMGDLTSNVAQLLHQGFMDVMENYPKIKVISKPAQWASDQAANVCQNVLVSTPKLDGVFMHSDACYASAVVSALEAAGKMKPVGHKKHVFLVGSDGSGPALELVRQKKVDIILSQPCADFGRVAGMFVLKTLQGEKIAKGEVKQEGALWSPARILDGPNGFVIYLANTIVDINNVDNPKLWGNFKAE